MAMRMLFGELDACLQYYLCWLHSFSMEKDTFLNLGHKQHLYSDCPSIISCSSIREVTELEGFFYLTFRDCKICEERKKKEKASFIAAKEQQERNELKAYLNNLIDSLDSGADPEDIKQQLQDDWGSDDEDVDVVYPDQP